MTVSRAFFDFINPYPPYFTRPDPDKVAELLTGAASFALTRQHEFPVCAAVISLDKIHPIAKNKWEIATVAIRHHWSKLQKTPDFSSRPGLNDFHIVSWSITGSFEHLQELISAMGRKDVRGDTARWAVGNLRRGCPEFAAAIEPLMIATAMLNKESAP